MTNFTIVAYRPNHVDTCRGCIVGSTCSDHEISVVGSVAEAAAKIAAYTVASDSSGSDYASWETTLLVDGKRAEDVDWHSDDYAALWSKCHKVVGDSPDPKNRWRVCLLTLAVQPSKYGAWHKEHFESASPVNWPAHVDGRPDRRFIRRTLSWHPTL